MHFALRATVPVPDMVASPTAAAAWMFPPQLPSSSRTWPIAITTYLVSSLHHRICPTILCTISRVTSRPLTSRNSLDTHSWWACHCGSLRKERYISVLTTPRSDCLRPALIKTTRRRTAAGDVEAMVLLRASRCDEGLANKIRHQSRVFTGIGLIVFAGRSAVSLIVEVWILDRPTFRRPINRGEASIVDCCISLARCRLLAQSASLSFTRPRKDVFTRS